MQSRIGSTLKAIKFERKAEGFRGKRISQLI